MNKIEIKFGLKFLFWSVSLFILIDRNELSRSKSKSLPRFFLEFRPTTLREIATLPALSRRGVNRYSGVARLYKSFATVTSSGKMQHVFQPFVTSRLALYFALHGSYLIRSINPANLFIATPFGQRLLFVSVSPLALWLSPLPALSTFFHDYRVSESSQQSKLWFLLSTNWYTLVAWLRIFIIGWFFWRIIISSFNI